MLTREEYKQWPIANRIGRLERTAADVAEALAGRGEPELARRPAPDSWSPKEVVCHLRDIEEQFILRFRSMLAMDNPKFLTLGDMPPNREEWGLAEGDALPLDPARWAEEREYTRQDAGLALANFGRRRHETLAFLSRLKPEQWGRGSTHTTLGPMDYGDWVALVAAHDDNHLDQLKKALNAGR
ncbi:MAG TPA: DinB family protein [Chloroflexota bacterium]|nr:DinB family protein [Chloroflexota bacterium]